MVRRFTEPRRDDFDTEEEYQEEMGYYDREMMLQEQISMEDYYEMKYATA